MDSLPRYRELKGDRSSVSFRKGSVIFGLPVGGFLGVSEGVIFVFDRGGSVGKRLTGKVHDRFIDRSRNFTESSGIWGESGVPLLKPS